MTSNTKIAIFAALALLTATFLNKVIQTTREADKSREALTALRSCSAEEIKRNLSMQSPPSVDEILEAVLDRCSVQYESVKRAAISSDFNAKDSLRNEIVSQQKRLSAQKQQTLEIEIAKKEQDRKIALIEDAIEKLKAAGVTEDDIKDHFRDEILEEERSSKNTSE